MFSKITITEKQKEALLANIHKKLAAQPIKLRSRFNLTCYTYEGIEAIREALLETKRQTADDPKFKLVIQLISPPQYKCEVVTLDKKGGEAFIEKAVEIVQVEIKKRGGIFKLVCKPEKIGSKGDEIEKDDILASMPNDNEDYSSGEESNDEAMKVDLDDEDFNNEMEEDDEEEKQAN